MPSPCIMSGGSSRLSFKHIRSIPLQFRVTRLRIEGACWLALVVSAPRSGTLLGVPRSGLRLRPGEASEADAVRLAGLAGLNGVTPSASASFGPRPRRVSRDVEGGPDRVTATPTLFLDGKRVTRLELFFLLGPHTELTRKGWPCHPPGDPLLDASLPSNGRVTEYCTPTLHGRCHPFLLRRSRREAPHSRRNGAFQLVGLRPRLRPFPLSIALGPGALTRR